MSEKDYSQYGPYELLARATDNPGGPEDMELQRMAEQFEARIFAPQAAAADPMDLAPDILRKIIKDGQLRI